MTHPLTNDCVVLSCLFVCLLVCLATGQELTNVDSQNYALLENVFGNGEEQECDNFR